MHNGRGISRSNFVQLIVCFPQYDTRLWKIHHFLLIYFRFVARNCKQLWCRCQIVLAANGDQPKPPDYSVWYQSHIRWVKIIFNENTIVNNVSSFVITGSISVCLSYHGAPVPYVTCSNRFHGNAAQKWHRRKEIIQICDACRRWWYCHIQYQVSVSVSLLILSMRFSFFICFFIFISFSSSLL